MTTPAGVEPEITKFCQDCGYYVVAGPIDTKWCTRPNNKQPDPISGRRYSLMLVCERDEGIARCGPEAKYYTPKVNTLATRIQGCCRMTKLTKRLLIVCGALVACCAVAYLTKDLPQAVQMLAGMPIGFGAVMLCIAVED